MGPVSSQDTHRVDAAMSSLKRALVLGLLVGYAAGCGGSQPADTAQQAPGAPGAAAVPQNAQRAPALGGSSITGTVTFAGDAPALRPLDMTAEAFCHEKHGGKPVPNEALVLGTGNTLGNIMVWVSKGLPARPGPLQRLRWFLARMAVCTSRT
jgi:hypothetical protein